MKKIKGTIAGIGFMMLGFYLMEVPTLGYKGAIGVILVIFGANVGVEALRGNDGDNLPETDQKNV